MNTEEVKSTSSYAYTATASKISYYYSGKQSWNLCEEFRMSVNSQTSYSRIRKGADKSNKIIRERLLCKETPHRWRLVGLGGGQGELRQDMRKFCKIPGHRQHHWGMIHLLVGHGKQGAPTEGIRWRTWAKRKWSSLPASRTVTHCVMGNRRSLSRLKMILDKFMKARSISAYQKSDPDATPAQNMLQAQHVYTQRDGASAAFPHLCCYRLLSEPGYFVKYIFENCYSASN